MPELPEVETTRRGIATIITGQPLQDMIVHESRLRWPVPSDLPDRVRHLPVQSCERRGKYLLLVFSRGTQIVHLGMSGSLRCTALDSPRLKHDHVEWRFPSARLVLHDPRRFGAVLWHDQQDGPVSQHPLLARVGIEPFDPAFDGKFLHRHLAGKSQAIKQTLLSGRPVAGVGNIYASEALFKACIHPLTPATNLSLRRCQILVEAIRDTLSQAIASGGSTLRDYVNASGEPGAYFAIHAAVYEREGLPCRRCGTLIRRITQGQRSTYYCPRCQRKPS